MTTETLRRVLSAARGTHGRGLFWSLMLGALLFAQTLGIMHALVHPPHAEYAGASQQLEQAHQHVDGEAGHHGRDWLHELFAGHEEQGSQCRVFDHQSHSALMPSVAALALPSVLQAFAPAVWVSCRLGAFPASFDARGPPLSH